MKKELLLLCALIMSVNFLVSAENGCLVPDENRVYTYNPKGEYDGTIFTPLSGGACSWTPTTTNTPCDVCKTALNNGDKCQGNSSNLKPGVFGAFTLVQCPLDDHIPLIIFAISALVVFELDRKMKLKLTDTLV
ncbi:MAG: hypothetical protein EOO42_07895 [Flavobacteriales bacterium]|nr:MAG: hypothetical protein EOO42_07895 [Flavobacteriales bacterium]